MLLNISRTAGDFYSVLVNIMVSGSNNNDIVIGGNGSVEFSPGDRLRTVTITAVDDDIPENEEVFLVTLSTDHSQAFVPQANKQIVVQENDVPVRFTQVNMTAVY